MNKIEIYASVFTNLVISNFSVESFYDFLLDGLEKYDRETLIIASIDVVIVNQSVEIYDLLVNEFMVSPYLFIVRSKSLKFEESEKTKDFFRHIKLRTILK